MAEQDHSTEPSGERLVLAGSDPDLRNEHLARYCFAEPLARGRRVLDMGCGEGYGTASLASHSAAACGLDNSAEALAHARANYPGVGFVRGDCARLPFADGALDLVTAFEVIEHLRDWQGLISEAARVLTPAGVLLVSTPNRDYYETTRAEPNPFHVKEFSHDEFQAALTHTFAHCTVFVENHAAAIAISSPEADPARAKLEGQAADPLGAHFFVAACSMSPIEGLAGVVYLPSEANLLRERELHIAELEKWIAALQARHAETEGRMSRELSRLPYRILRRLGLAPKLPPEW